MNKITIFLVLVIFFTISCDGIYTADTVLVKSDLTQIQIAGKKTFLEKGKGVLENKLPGITKEAVFYTKIELDQEIRNQSWKVRLPIIDVPSNVSLYLLTEKEFGRVALPLIPLYQEVFLDERGEKWMTCALFLDFSLEKWEKEGKPVFWPPK